MLARTLLLSTIFALSSAIAIAETATSKVAAGLADGTWIVEEACGENKAGKDTEAQRPFNWEIEFTVKGDRITGAKHSVNTKTNVVIDLAYHGSIAGSKIEIDGTGRRSNLERPWLYSYQGTISPEGRAELSGPLAMRIGGQPKTFRACKLTFLVLKSDALPSMAFARNVDEMRLVNNAMVQEAAALCDTAADAALAKDPKVPAPDTRTCVSDKLREGLSKAVSAPSPLVPELQFTAFAPSLIKPNTGPKAAKGVIYYVGGYGKHEDDHRLVPYYLKSLTDNGWDLIAERLPNANIDDTWEADSYQVPGGVTFVQRRLKEIKALGYKRIVLAGFSWGGWVSLVASQIPDLPADMLLVNALVVFGHKVVEGKPNLFFDINMTAYKPVMAQTKLPAVLIFPNDPEDEPDAKLRGAIADVYLTHANLPHRIIAGPPGFTAHYAAWLPFFDFAYGKCIADFLDKPSAAMCRTPRISDTDFRSILSLKQVPNEKAKRVVSAQSLAGAKYVAYTLEDEDFKHFAFVSASERLTSVWNRSFKEPIAVHDDEFCASQVCSILIRWSDDTLLQFDKASGALKAWWFLEK